ncbi:MAG: uridine kinase [Planctomycetota bacterium]
MRQRPFLLGISGGSGSGKTSLTRALQDALGAEGCSVLDHDSYYRDLSDRPLSARERVNFDHPDSLDNDLLAHHLGALQSGRPVERPVYDFATHTRTRQTKRVEARPLVICEGILVLAVPALRRRLDLSVFVDAPADIRALRRVQRDVGERGRTVASVVQQYCETVRPMHAQFVEPAKRVADLVLDWRRAPDEQAHAVLAEVGARREGRAAGSAT